MKKMVNRFFVIAFSLCVIIGCNSNKEIAGEKENGIFNFTNDGEIMISGHRGGIENGYPENCIASFEYVLSKVETFFEIDPRLTKDSVIVLMHDATLNRTTTASGKLADYYWNEIKDINLKDFEGNKTKFHIPRLDEVIKWSRGKTIVNLDKKDVPMEMIVRMIEKLDAADHVMLTVHTGAQARYYYDRLPNVMLSAFCRNWKEYEDMNISGVPWKNMIAYVGHSITSQNEEIVRKLHQKGVKCMISVAPTHDRLKNQVDRDKGYKKEILLKPDIIESDRPVEVGKLIK